MATSDVHQELPRPETRPALLTIVQTSDWHLGRRYVAFPPEARQRLARSRLEVVDRILDVAADARADALLCAGDLFDSPDPDAHWWQGLAMTFRRRREPPCAVYLLPGNHDPLGPRSVYAPSHPFRAHLPPWVHVVDREPYEASLGAHATLVAIPVGSRAGVHDLARRIPERAQDDDRLRVGLVHGQSFAMLGVAPTHPIARGTAAARGLDYLALGDTHGFRDLAERAAAPEVYAGTPEQLAYGEDGAGTVCVARFYARGERPALERVRVGRYEWLRAPITEMSALRRLAAQDLRATVLTLAFALRVTPVERDEIRAIVDELRGTEAHEGRAAALLVDEAELVVDQSELRATLYELPPVLARVAERLFALADGGASAAERDHAARAIEHLRRLVRDEGPGAPGPSASARTHAP